MNANAEIKTAESFFETTTTTNAEFEIHEANKTFKHIQTPKKATNMTQYLSKYKDKLNDLSQYEINIDAMDDNNNYKYDKEFKTEKQINKAIIKLIRDMFYNLGSGVESKILRLKINYFIENQFKFPFFIMEEKAETATFYNIFDLFKYIKRTIKGKNGDKLFNKIEEFKCEFIPEIKAEPLKQEFKCAVCLEDKENEYIINFNCNCKDLICQGCFNTLPQPKKCPLCRKTPYKLNLTIAEDEPAKRRFTIKYNNKIYEEDIKFSILEDETLFYFDTNKEKIIFFKLRLKTYDDILNEIIDDDDNFFSFCCYKADLYYLQFHSKTELGENIIKVCLDATYEDKLERWEFIEDVLGLRNNNDRREFLSEYYNNYGAENMMYEEQYKDSFDYIMKHFNNSKERTNLFVDYYEGNKAVFKNLFHLEI